MARKQDLRCKCPWCGCRVIVRDYANRYPDKLCICRKSECIEKEANRLEAWYHENGATLLSAPPEIDVRRV